MTRNQFPAAAMTLAVVTVTLVVVFMLASVAGAADRYKTLYKFKGGKDGFYPMGSLVFDGAGNLYSTTWGGGANWNSGAGPGTVFQLTPNPEGRWTKSVPHNFTYWDGSNPRSAVIFDQAGNMYGTTQGGNGPDGGYGVVFELTSEIDGSWIEKVLYTFAGGKDGVNPRAGVASDGKGNLYGTTYFGGNLTNCSDGGCGVAFRLTANSDGSWTESVLYQFQNGDDGARPMAGLVSDAEGNLYGTTIAGGGGPCQFGSGGCGTLFKLTPNQDGSWTEKVLHRFTGGKDGAWPMAGLAFDKAGRLYGTTSDGGAHGWGTVFQLTPNAQGEWTYRVLHQFDLRRGGAPYADLVFDSAGSIYGTTQYGSAYNFGTVFKLTPRPDGGWSYRVLHNFKDHPGCVPSAGLIVDAAGNLYGTTLGDGTTTFGSVFEITP